MPAATLDAYFQPFCNHLSRPTACQPFDPGPEMKSAVYTAFQPPCFNIPKHLTGVESNNIIGRHVTYIRHAGPRRQYEVHSTETRRGQAVMTSKMNDNDI